MSERHLEFKLMLGIQANEEMPEDLRKQLTKYVERDISNIVQDGLDALIEKYCEENGHSRKGSSSKIEKFDNEKDFRDHILNSNKNPKDSLEDFFSKIGEKRGISRKKSLSALDEIDEEIESLVQSFSHDRTDEGLSKNAFRVLELRIKAETLKMKEALDQQDLNERIQEGVERLKIKFSKSKKDLIEQLEKDINRGPLVIEQGIADLQKLQLIDYEEYSKLDHESRGKYLIQTKLEFNKILDFVETELKQIKSRLMQTVTGEMGFGDHLSIVLS